METTTKNFIIEAGNAIAASQIDFNNVIYKYAGPANRFIRQTIINDLTGEKNQLVKCGISYLKAAFEAYQQKEAVIGAQFGAEYTKKQAKKAAKDEPKADIVSEQCSVSEPTAPIAPMVGLAVIRKAYQRNGKVLAIEGDKVTVELADGSVRRPNVDRFKKLYNVA